jgi:hypothetical protein
MYLSLCFLEKLGLYILSFLFDSGEGVMVGYKIPCSFLLSDLFFCLLLEGTRQGAYIYNISRKLEAIYRSYSRIQLLGGRYHYKKIKKK